jgi:colanic acid/amylovoran biosynthesis glycosyltransferase
MRIAFFVSGFPALSETFIINQINDLIRRGHEIEIFSTHFEKNGMIHDGVREYNLIDKTVYLNSLPKGRFKKISGLILWILNHCSLSTLELIYRFLINSKKNGISVYQLISFNNKKKYDVVHAHFGQNGDFVSRLIENGLFKEALFVTTFHGYDLEITPENPCDYNNLFRTCNRFTVNSNYSKSKLIKLGCSAEKIYLLPVGLDIHKFQLRESRNYQSGPIIILFVGRLIEVKGPDLLIQICNELKKRNTFEFKSIIVGESSMKNQLKQSVIALGLQCEVSFLGGLSQEQILEEMERADIFILPGITKNGRAETQGLVIQEAQAMQLPVIVSDAGGMKEGMIDGETGFVIPEGNIALFVDALEKLAKDPELRSKMGAEGRRFVQTNYSIQHLNDQLLQIYS